MQIQLLQTEQQEIKPNRYITLTEQKDFCDFLANFQVNPERLAKMRWCASEWERYHCSADHTHTIKRRYLNCGLRGECPRCSMSYAHQRAEIMYQWIKRNLADKLDFDLKINQITLTLPEELHELDEKIFAKMIKSFMKLQDIEAFGYVIQTRHSENPLDKKYHHAHVLTLNIKKNNQSLEQNDYYFDLDVMRQNWKNTVEKFAKISIEGNVNLHNEYASILRQKPTVMHLLAYVYRYSIQDLFEVQVRVRSINYLEFPQFEGVSLPSYILQIEDIGSKVSDILNESKNNFVWCGLLSSIRREELKGLISGYSSQLDLEGNEIAPIFYDWQTLEQIKKEIFERAKTCRDCGFLYEEIPFERGQYDADDEF
jgi:hypothetical protein